MKKREFTNLPIRTIDKLLQNKEVSKFEIDPLNPEGIKGRFIVEPHRHDFYHIMLVKSGYGKHFIDFKTYEVRPNTMFFVSPGQVHSLDIEANAEGYVISFDSDFYLLNDSLQKLLDFPFFHSINNVPYIYLETQHQKIIDIWEDINNEFHSDTSNKDGLIRALLEVLLVRASRCYSQPSQEKTPAYLTYQIRKLEALIDTHFREYRLLNDYAELMHISPKHLNSLCKKGLNKTVTNLIHERSLVEAKRLLLFTNNSISEIAYELGFTDKSYFMRFFKKHTGLTADTYRHQNA